VSPALPAGLSGADVAKTLERAGFQHVSTRGSHAKYRSGSRTVIMPLHSSLAPGTPALQTPAGQLDSANDTPVFMLLSSQASTRTRQPSAIDRAHLSTVLRR
jgi:predicted RNA binding protein YcfA (HicA-like mRNA interferase family)